MGPMQLEPSSPVTRSWITSSTPGGGRHPPPSLPVPSLPDPLPSPLLVPPLLDPLPLPEPMASVLAPPSVGLLGVDADEHAATLTPAIAQARSTARNPRL